MDRDGIWSGVAHINFAIRTVSAKCPHAGSFEACVFPDLAQEIDGGAFAIGACDGDHVLRLSAIERCGGLSEREARFIGFNKC